MKKLLFVFVALFFIAGFTMAEDVGITVGLEVGVGNLTTVDDSNIEPYVMPNIAFETSFFDGALDLYAELAFTIGIYDDNPMDLYAYLELAYNFFLGPDSTLTFILGNEIDPLMISPWDDGPNMISILRPGIRFTQDSCLNYNRIGELYAEVIVPIVYLQFNPNADMVINLEPTLGWDSLFGLGLSITPLFALVPDFEYSGLVFFASFDGGLVHAELEVVIPSEMDYGITATPEVAFNIFDGFSAYLRCVVDGIAGNGDMVLTPGLGIRYSF